MPTFNEKKPKVLISVLHQGWIRPELTQRVALMESDERVDVEVLYTALRPSENNRNHTVRETLRGGFDWLLTIDHDIVPRSNPIDLIFWGKKIVGCACPVWNVVDPTYPLYFVGMDKVDGGYKEHKERAGLQKVDAVGSGCLLIHKDVLDVVEEPFVRKFEGGFAVVGLDFYFCEKAIEAGFDVYCHYDYQCSHFREVDLLDVFNFKEYGG